jgi:hypothetical protein
MGDSVEMRPQVSRPARYCERADHPSQEGAQYAARGHHTAWSIIVLENLTVIIDQAVL